MHKNILELEFKNRRKEFATNPLQFPFQAGNLAIVEVDKGLDLGKVAFIGVRPGAPVDIHPEISVLRKATIAESKVLEQNRVKEHEARAATKAKIREHELDMKLVDIELQWDGRKMTFYFTADGRVDFRELVKDLAGHFRTRIDLRQIGARDETKKTSGYGVCGQPLCCATFLTEFKPITTQMPRDQFLPLNPTKLSGVCGRLKCCLRYEVDVYREFQRECPKVGHPTKDEFKGDGHIDKIDVMREQIQIRYGNGEVDAYSVPEFKEISDWKPETPKNQCICTCGRKQQGKIALPTAQEKLDENVHLIEEGPGGEKVTLLAGGGLGLRGGESGKDREVGLSVNVTPQRRDQKDLPKKPQGPSPYQRNEGGRPTQPPIKSQQPQKSSQPQPSRPQTQQQSNRPQQNQPSRPQTQQQPNRPQQNQPSKPQTQQHPKPQQPLTSKPPQAQDSPQNQGTVSNAGQQPTSKKKHHRGKHRGRGGNASTPPNSSSPQS